MNNKKIDNDKCKFSKMALSMGSDLYNENNLKKLLKNDNDYIEAINKGYIEIVGKNSCNEDLYCLTELAKDLFVRNKK